MRRDEWLKNLTPPPREKSQHDERFQALDLNEHQVDDEVDEDGNLMGETLSDEEYYRLCEEDAEDEDPFAHPGAYPSKEAEQAAIAEWKAKQQAKLATASRSAVSSQSSSGDSRANASKPQPIKQSAKQESSSSSRAKANRADLCSPRALLCSTGKRTRSGAAKQASEDRDGDSKMAVDTEEAEAGSSGKQFSIPSRTDAR